MAQRTLITSALVVALAGCGATLGSAAQNHTPDSTTTPTASASNGAQTSSEPSSASALATPEPTPVGCPILPVTIEEIASLAPGRALACFGGAPLTFEAYVPPHPYGIGGSTDHTLSPAWLDGLGGSVVALSAGPDAGILVLANVPPGLGRCDSGTSIPECPFHRFEGGRALVHAHFDDPVARTCRAVSSIQGSTFTDAEAVAECRRLLIVVSVGAPLP